MTDSIEAGLAVCIALEQAEHKQDLKTDCILHWMIHYTELGLDKERMRHESDTTLAGGNTDHQYSLEAMRCDPNKHRIPQRVPLQQVHRFFHRKSRRKQRQSRRLYAEMLAARPQKYSNSAAERNR